MIATIGLGNIGLALARRLHARGREVVGVDIAEGRRTVWSVLIGRPAASSVDELDWRAVERVLVVVRTPAQVEETLPRIRAGAEGAGRHGVPVHVITTITPADARRLPVHASPALRLIENPLTGGEAPALMGTQTSMIAGEHEASDVAFLRDGLMEEVVVFDNYGEPALAKLLNNLACAYNLAVFGMVLSLGEERGLDVEKLRRVIVRGSGTSFSARAVIEMIGDLLAKDVALAEQVLGAAPPVAPTDIENQLAATRALLKVGAR